MAKQTVQPQQAPTAEQKSPSTLYKVADYLYPRVMSALDDIYRRLFAEPWFSGKTPFDVLHNQTQRYAANQNDKTIEDDKQPVKEAKGHQHDFTPDAFYGRNQGKETEQHPALGRDDDLGMER